MSSPLGAKSHRHEAAAGDLATVYAGRSAYASGYCGAVQMPLRHYARHPHLLATMARRPLLRLLHEAIRELREAGRL